MEVIVTISEEEMEQLFDITGEIDQEKAIQYAIKDFIDAN